MLDIARINELAKKSKTVGLTPEEKEEQTRLRKEYVQSVVGNLRAQLDNTYVLDKDENKVKLTVYNNVEKKPCDDSTANEKGASQSFSQKED